MAGGERQQGGKRRREGGDIAGRRAIATGYVSAVSRLSLGYISPLANLPSILGTCLQGESVCVERARPRLVRRQPLGTMGARKLCGMTNT